MKFQVSLLIVVFLGLMSIESSAQCDYSIKVSQKVRGNVGSITAKLNNVGNYEYVLYAYENGTKTIIAKEKSNSDKVVISDLRTNRYYKMEFTFEKVDNFLCEAWVSELINFNN